MPLFASTTYHKAEALNALSQLIVARASCSILVLLDYGATPEQAEQRSMTPLHRIVITCTSAYATCTACLRSLSVTAETLAACCCYTPFVVQDCLTLFVCDSQLPDGNEIQIGPDRFKVPEILFQPVRLSVCLLTYCLDVFVMTRLPTAF